MSEVVGNPGGALSHIDVVDLTRIIQAGGPTMYRRLCVALDTPEPIDDSRLDVEQCFANEVERTPPGVCTPAPDYGQHTDEVLGEFGYRADDIARFHREGVV